MNIGRLKYTRVLGSSFYIPALLSAPAPVQCTATCTAVSGTGTNKKGTFRCTPSIEIDYNLAEAEYTPSTDIAYSNWRVTGSTVAQIDIPTLTAPTIPSNTYYQNYPRGSSIDNIVLSGESVGDTATFDLNFTLQSGNGLQFQEISPGLDSFNVVRTEEESVVRYDANVLCTRDRYEYSTHGASSLTQNPISKANFKTAFTFTITFSTLTPSTISLTPTVTRAAFTSYLPCTNTFEWE